MCWKFIVGKFYDEKFFDKELKDWFLFRNFKMEFYDKEVGLYLLYFFFFKVVKILSFYFQQIFMFS